MSFCDSCGERVPADAPAGLCPRCLASQALLGALDADGEDIIDVVAEELREILPEYEIAELLGRGATSLVFLANHRRLDRSVAIKVMKPEVRDSEFAPRFEREAQALARLKHPHIVTIHDFGQAGDLYYLVMEYVEGATLRDLTREGRLQPEQALQIVPQLCHALEFAHERGVVHRDIKPENILLDLDGQVRLTDFGIAKLPVADETQLTSSGDVMGTPHYMAPEQIHSPTAVDHRADIYSLGVVLYELLTGRLPRGSFAPPSTLSEVAKDVDRVVLRSLKDRPHDRYQSVADLRDDVEGVRLGKGTRRRRATRAFVRVLKSRWLRISACCILGLIVLVVIIAALREEDHPRRAPRLIQAAATGDLDEVKRLVGGWNLFARSDIDVRDSDGWTALMFACEVGHTEMALYLIDAGADVNAAAENGESPLLRASWNGWIPIVERLLEEGADVTHADADGETALLYAANEGHASICQTLIDAGARVDRRAHDGDHALLVACNSGSVAAARTLLDAGAPVSDANDWGVRPIHVAATHGLLSIIRRLIEEGAHFDAQTKSGLTPLMEAASEGQRSTVLELLKLGAQTDSRTNNGWSVVTWALSSGDVSFARELLEFVPEDEYQIEFVEAFLAGKSGDLDRAQRLLEQCAEDPIDLTGSFEIPIDGWDYVFPELSISIDLCRAYCLHQAGEEKRAREIVERYAKAETKVITILRKSYVRQSGDTRTSSTESCSLKIPGTSTRTRRHELFDLSGYSEYEESNSRGRRVSSSGSISPKSVFHCP